MDSKEILYELSLKYNTLKMYDNTLDQMKKNGVANEKSIKTVQEERDALEEELIKLLSPDTMEEQKVAKTVGMNGFVAAANEKAKREKELTYKRLYKRNYYNDNSFFDEVKLDTPQSEERISETEDYRPKYSDIQDKISNSKWISSSNFITIFPKNLNIDPWRVAHVNYITSNNKEIKGGEIYVDVNSFADVDENGNYNILEETVVNLENNMVDKVIGNIQIDVIDNGGNVMYTNVFKDCKFMCAMRSPFDYNKTELRKITLSFIYKKLIVVKNEATDKEG